MGPGFRRDDSGDGEMTGLEQLLVEIIPTPVVLLDQLNLPSAMVALELLLSCDRQSYITEHLVVDQSRDVVAFGEAIDEVLTVLIHSTDKIVCHANLERTVDALREQVDEVGPAHLANHPLLPR